MTSVLADIADNVQASLLIAATGRSFSAPMPFNNTEATLMKSRLCSSSCFCLFMHTVLCDEALGESLAAINSPADQLAGVFN